MTSVNNLQHHFVDGFPDKLGSGVLYIALDFSAMSHLCCCGCKQEVITPLSPNDWKITFDGESISIHPSIGNWSLPCRSHYIIRNGWVQWANDWSDEQIREGRDQDLIAKRGIVNAPLKPKIPLNAGPDVAMETENKTLWRSLIDLIFRK